MDQSLQNMSKNEVPYIMIDSFTDLPGNLPDRVRKLEYPDINFTEELRGHLGESRTRVARALIDADGQRPPTGASIGVVFHPELYDTSAYPGPKPIGSAKYLLKIEVVEQANFEFMKQAILLGKEVLLCSPLKSYAPQASGEKAIKGTAKERALLYSFGYQITEHSESVTTLKRQQLTDEQQQELLAMHEFQKDSLVRQKLREILVGQGIEAKQWQASKPRAAQQGQP